jgi:hypothetical protein
MIMIKPAHRINPQPSSRQSSRHGRHEPHSIKTAVNHQRDFLARERRFQPSDRIDRRLLGYQRPALALAEEHLEGVLRCEKSGLKRGVCWRGGCEDVGVGVEDGSHGCEEGGEGGQAGRWHGRSMAGRLYDLLVPYSTELIGN